jgi:D-alanyl-D-alanine carboxypeptidase
MMTTPDPYSDGLRNFTNNNPVVGMDEYLGGKNGYTDEARHTLLSLFSVESTDGDRNIAIIVLGSENRGDDTRKLLNWIKRVI